MSAVWMMVAFRNTSSIVGENSHAFFNCDLHGVLKFSQVVGVVPWYVPLRFGRGGRSIPRWNLWGGGAFPPGITNIFKKSRLCQFVMDSKDIYICRSAMTYTILQKIAAILNFLVNMPPSWILCVFGPF